MPAAASTPHPHGTPERRFSLRQRALLWIIGWAGYLAIRLLVPTLLFGLSKEEGVEITEPVRSGIFAFWHRCVFPAAWRFRGLGIGVMTSRSFDGEYIARIIERLGFRAVRGSSSRGGSEALRQMERIVRRGEPVAFTVDGPRGPRYVAKPGPVILARRTGVPVHAFYIALDRPWVLKTWDGFMIPRPFSRALVRVSRPVHVPADADLHDYLPQLQEALERARLFAEEHVNLPRRHRDTEEIR